MMYEPGSQAKETPGLEDYLAAIRQRKWLILLCAALGLAAGVLFTNTQEKTWEASAKVLVNSTPINGRLERPTLEREREVVDSNAVARLVADELDLTTNPLLMLRDLDVIFVDFSDTLQLLYVNPDPAVAQDVVNSFARQYVLKRNSEADDRDDTLIALYQADIVVLNSQLDDLDIELSALSRQANAAEGLPSASAIDDQIKVNNASRNAVLNDLRDRSNDLSDAQIAKNTRTPPAELLQSADLPTVPSGFSDNILRALGLVLGLGLGVALAFVLNRLDRTARESGDVELALGTSVLASIPSFGMAYRSGSSAIIMLSGGRSAKVQRSREAFRRLRSSVQFLGTTREADTFLITSARPAEGKSTTAANLAIALAQGETKVCLVNADLRRPTIEKVLGIPTNQHGLGDWLADPNITNIMVSVPGTPGLVVVPAGPPPPNPGELLATGRFASLMEELSEQFDIVLIDAPPVLSAADASSISSAVDGVIIVVDSSRTDTDTLLRVRAEIDRAGGKVVGAILNRDNSDVGGSVLRKDRYAYEKVTASRSSELA
jgi:capsular exopolysaccharide synthesis family protein